jgi:hypothetical protein
MKMSSGQKWLFRLGGSAALILLALFLIGAAGITCSQPAAIHNRLSVLQNWLIVLFKLNVGSCEIQPDALNALNLLDIIIMALFGVMFLPVYVALRQTARTWSVVAASLPFLGIAVFLATHTAGRSGLMIGGLIFSIIMLKSDTFLKATAYLGIAAAMLLFFAGDLGTTFFSPLNLIAISISIGYLLWMIWFCLIAQRLLHLSSRSQAA